MGSTAFGNIAGSQAPAYVTQSLGPKVYADWIPLIERFEAGDDTALNDMEAGTLEWTNVVAPRWTAHISRAMTTRLQRTSSQLQLGFTRSRGDLFAVAQAMLGARRSLYPLVRLTSLPCMDAEVRKHLVAELTRFVDESQQSLEKSAMEGGRVGEPVLRVLRENRLRLSLSSDHEGTAAEKGLGSVTESPARPRRTFITDANV